MCSHSAGCHLTRSGGSPALRALRSKWICWFESFEDKSPSTISRTSMIHSGERISTWANFGHSMPVACCWGVEGTATRQSKFLLQAENLNCSLWPGWGATHNGIKKPPHCRKWQLLCKLSSPLLTISITTVKIILYGKLLCSTEG